MHAWPPPIPFLSCTHTRAFTYLPTQPRQLEILKKEVKGLLGEWNNDNNMIYFSQVVDPLRYALPFSSVL